jgi:hypothetical protein
MDEIRCPACLQRNDEEDLSNFDGCCKKCRHNFDHFKTCQPRIRTIKKAVDMIKLRNKFDGHLGGTEK